MRHFYLYLIKEEFASHYFGREFKLFQLFQDFLWTSRDDERYDTLKQQVEYVSKQIPVDYLDELISLYLNHQYNYQHIAPLHRIHLRSNRGKASLILKPRNVEITATGSFESETVFFEILFWFELVIMVTLCPRLTNFLASS